MIQLDSGYALRIDFWDDGPYPVEYRKDGFVVSENRIPQLTLDELHKQAWSAWHERGHGVYEEDCCDD